MLFTDNPCRIPTPGTHDFGTHIGAVYTIGRDFVAPALFNLLSKHKSLACDIETFGLGLAARRLKSVSFGNGVHAVVLDPRDPRQAELIRSAFSARSLEEIVFHNSPYDVPNLYINGLIRLEDVHKITDTLIYSRLANPGETVKKSLEAACDRYLKTGPGGELKKAFKTLGISSKEGFRQFDLDRPIYAQGAASDPLLTYRLLPVVRQAAFNRLTVENPFKSRSLTESEAWELVEREQRINRHITLPRTCKGMRVDFEYLERYQEQNVAELRDAEKELAEYGIRPGSGPDLAKVLEERGEMPEDFPRTEKSGAYSMTKDTIPRLGSPIAKKFIRQKEITKIGKDYLGKVVELAHEGRVHSQVNLLAAATGRESMGEPPFHQFSGPARGIMLADEGDSLTSVDLSQGEPITIANAAQDFGVIEGYESGRSDVYTELAVKAHMLPIGTTTADCENDKRKKLIRGQLKQALLAQLYGQGLPLLSAKLGLDIGPYGPPSDWEVEARGYDPKKLYPKYAAAAELRANVYKAMPKTETFIKRLKALATQHRKMITISGRVLDIPYSAKFHRIEAHKGVNYFCQGGQYDLIADAKIRIIEAGLHEALYLTMHDEFVVSTSASRDVQKILQTPSERFCLWSKRTPILRTDLKDLGERWAAA